MATVDNIFFPEF